MGWQENDGDTLAKEQQGSWIDIPQCNFSLYNIKYKKVQIIIKNSLCLY